MVTTTIKIKNVQYLLKYTLRMFFLFENIAGKPFSFGKLLDEYLLFYACLMANNEGFSIPFDEFINLCDVDPQLFSEFKRFVLKQIEIQAQTATPEPEPVKKKTKRTKR